MSDQEFIQLVLMDYHNAMNDYIKTGEPIWFDSRHEAVIIANHLRQCGELAKIMQEGNFYFIEKPKPTAIEVSAKLTMLDILNNYAKIRRLRGGTGDTNEWPNYNK